MEQLMAQRREPPNAPFFLQLPEAPGLSAYRQQSLFPEFFRPTRLQEQWSRFWPRCFLRHLSWEDSKYRPITWASRASAGHYQTKLRDVPRERVFGGVLVGLQRFDLTKGIEIADNVLQAVTIIEFLQPGYAIATLALIQLGLRCRD